MIKSKEVVFCIFTVFLFSCTTNKTPKVNNQSRVISISFECNLLDGVNDKKILEPYEMYFDVLIENTSTDTLYFGSTNTRNFPTRRYGYFLLISSSDSIELDTTLDSSYAIPPNTNFNVDVVCNAFEIVKKFSVSPKTKSDEIYKKITEYKLLFIPYLEDFVPHEREYLVFSSYYIFNLDSVNVSYLSAGKSYLELDF